MNQRLKNKVAIVTGGGAGIGEAICKKFAAEGAKVIVCGFPEDPVQEVAYEIQSKGGDAIAFQGDISQPENAQNCVALAVTTWGKLDILINNAGVFPAVGTIDKYPNSAFDYLIKNNTQSMFMMTKYAVPLLQKTKGCIVAAGSEAGMNGEPENTPYGATKGWVHAFTRGVAVEQAQYGVRANVVCPGPIDTAWTHDETGPMSVKMEKQLIAGTPMGRRGTPEEVANVYLFLASDEASYVTGALYTVDGGITITKGPNGLMADEFFKKEPEGELDLQHSKEGDTVKRKFARTDEGEFRQESWNQALSSSKTRKSGSGSALGLSLGIAAIGAIFGLVLTNTNASERFRDVAEKAGNGFRSRRNQQNQATDDTREGAVALADDGNTSSVGQNRASSGSSTTGNESNGGYTIEGATGNVD